MRGVPYLSEVVSDLYDASLRATSRYTYRTGQRAYDRFMANMANGRYFPFEPQALSETELNLAFFMAFLLLELELERISDKRINSEIRKRTAPLRSGNFTKSCNPQPLRSGNFQKFRNPKPLRSGNFSKIKNPNPLRSGNFSKF